ncbi:zinc finger protein 594-like isoform X5 [Siniperca chuatsi]|uniref:zinc finger protein 594-like isoform X5 n=1 Tax=Siniperca chuatsi TaxID=119488 RepID=UPI001CE18230|nr:zinc finger protein 594-like isoform X5 [Siniperca chuatsi]
MSKVQTLRAFVSQRLSAAAEEIFELFERTIAEYEEELCGQRKLLDAVFQPEVRLHRADLQQLSVCKEEDPPEQQDWSPSLDQDPEPPHIKEEQEELWTSQEGEQLRGLEEADIIKFTFTPVTVKSEEDDEEKPQSSQLHQRLTEQMKTEADGEDCGGPEPARKSDPDTNDKTSDSSEPETDDSCDWEETREPQSGLNPLQNNSGEKSFSCSVCGKQFSQNSNLKRHMKIPTGEKPFSCSVCSRGFIQKVNLTLHTEQKRYSCTVCSKRFTWLYQLENHQCVGRQSSQLHQRLTEQMKTEADGEDCGGPGPAREPQSDLQLLSVSKEEVPPEQQDWSPSLDQEDPPEPPHIKEEQEELWTSQEGEQLQGLEEADIIKFTFTPVPVKSEEDDEEKPQSSQLHQRLTEQVKTEADGEDCGEPEPARNSDPDTRDKTSDSSEPETDDSCDWEETRNLSQV